MKGVLFLLFIFNVGVVIAENTIVAVVNSTVITYKSIESKLLSANSYEEKIDLINQKIDYILQLKKANELNIEPSLNDIDLTLLSIAKNNNISIEKLRAYPEFLSLETEVSEKIAILNLQRLITKNVSDPNNEILNICFKKDTNKSVKQIKIAQIIISELGIQDQNDQNEAIKVFLNKLSKHIKKGASFAAFAKLHSQHQSYLIGGESEWINVDNLTIKMLDSLKKNEISKVYSTDFGFAIGIKLEERFVSSNLKQCKEKLIYLNAEKFYYNWVSELRKQAYIKIHHDVLL